MGNGEIESAFNTELGHKLRVRRKQQGISQEDLGAQMGVHRNTINRWETGGAGMTVWDFLRACDGLQIQHLGMLPAKSYTWGEDVGDLQRERDRHTLKAIQAERDPPLRRDEA